MGRIILVLGVATALFLAFQAFISSMRPPPATSQTNRSPFSAAPFSGSGNLVRRASIPQGASAEWRLSSETPGMPAQGIPLLFDRASVCAVGPARKRCIPDEFEEGDRAAVVGTRTEEGIIVRELTLFP